MAETKAALGAAGLATSLLLMCRQWGERAALSLGDQALTSGANFAVSIVLARWLAPESYGAFAVAFSFYLLLGGMHNALILEPMKVLGSSRYAETPRSYMRAMLLFHALLTILTALILTAISLLCFRNTPVLGKCILSFAAVMPLLLLFLLFRHMAYMRLLPGIAIKGSFLYAILLMSALVIARCLGGLNPFTAPLLMGAASAGASVGLWVWTTAPATKQHENTQQICFGRVFREHWRYGKWVLAAGFVAWASGALYLPLIGAYVGLANAGKYRAAENLMLPMGQVLTALCIMLLPWLSRRVLSAGPAYLRRTALKLCMVLGTLSGGYVAVVSLAGSRLTTLLYGGGKYSSVAWLLPALGFCVMLRSVSDSGAGLVLRAMGRTDILFWATLCGAANTITVGRFLVSRFGLGGAALGLVLSSIVQTIVIWLLFQRVLRAKEAATP